MKSPSEELPETRRLELLRHALAALPPAERSLLLRYHQEGEQRIQSRQSLSKELGIPMNVLRLKVHRLKRKVELRLAQSIHNEALAMPVEEPKPEHMEQLIRDEVPATPAEETGSRTPPMEFLRRLLQNRFPVLYAQVLEPTLADLRQEHSAALTQGYPLKARLVLLQGCGALAAAAVCQSVFSLRGRLAAFWKARSSK